MKLSLSLNIVKSDSSPCLHAAKWTENPKIIHTIESNETDDLSGMNFCNSYDDNIDNYYVFTNLQVNLSSRKCRLI